MSQDSNSAIQIELALRGARLAKAALEFLSLPLASAGRQTRDLDRQVQEIREFLARRDLW
jgi:hypothetical protein